MQYVDISSLTFNQIRLFLAAAKYQNFSLAADSLNVTQPLVSRTISLLEQSIGFPLFTRDHKKVTLNAAGQELYRQWKHLYATVEHSLEAAYKVYESSNATLTIYDDYITSRSIYLTPIAETFSRQWPDITLHIDQMSPEEIVHGVLSGHADVGFLMGPELIRLKGTDAEHRILLESPFCADVAPHSLLYPYDTLTLQDFEGVPITLMSNAIASVYTKAVMDLFLNAGVKPQVKSYVASNSALDFARVNKDSGAVIVNDMVPLIEGTKRIPILGTRTSLSIFWRRNNDSPLLKAFLRTAESTMADFELRFPLK